MDRGKQKKTNIRAIIRKTLESRRLQHTLDKLHQGMANLGLSIKLDGSRLSISRGEPEQTADTKDLFLAHLFRRLEFQGRFDRQMMDKALAVHTHFQDIKADLFFDVEFMCQLSQVLDTAGECPDLGDLSMLCLDVCSVYGADQRAVSVAEHANPELIIEMTRSLVRTLLDDPLIQNSIPDELKDWQVELKQKLEDLGVKERAIASILKDGNMRPSYIPRIQELIDAVGEEKALEVIDQNHKLLRNPLSDFMRKIELLKEEGSSTEAESTTEAAPVQPVAEPPTEPESTQDAAPVQSEAEPAFETESTQDAEPVQPEAEPTTEAEIENDAAPVQPEAAPSIEPESTEEAKPVQPEAAPSIEPESTEEAAPVQPVAEPSIETETTQEPESNLIKNRIHQIVFEKIRHLFDSEAEAQNIANRFVENAFSVQLKNIYETKNPGKNHEEYVQRRVLEILPLVEGECAKELFKYCGTKFGAVDEQKSSFRIEAIICPLINRTYAREIWHNFFELGFPIKDRLAFFENIGDDATVYKIIKKRIEQIRSDHPDLAGEIMIELGAYLFSTEERFDSAIKRITSPEETPTTEEQPTVFDTPTTEHPAPEETEASETETEDVPVVEETFETEQPTHTDSPHPPITQREEHRSSKQKKKAKQRNGLRSLIIPEADQKLFDLIAAVSPSEDIAEILDSRGIDPHEFAYVAIKIFDWTNQSWPRPIIPEVFAQRLNESAQQNADGISKLMDWITESDNSHIRLTSSSSLNPVSSELLNFLKHVNNKVRDNL
jgi:hypothetical protein